jgi:hypothetical protein
MVTDTGGLLVGVAVHPADIQFADSVYKATQPAPHAGRMAIGRSRSSSASPPALKCCRSARLPNGPWHG